MKSTRIFTVLILMALILPACGGPSTAPDVLNLYGWSEYVPEQVLQDFTDTTGIKVNYDTYSSNEEMLAKLQAGASGYDVIIPSDYTVAIMIKQDMLEPLDKSQIPNFDNLNPRFTDQDYDPGDTYSIPYQWGTTALAYDSTRVPSEPTSWADIWDPAYKSRLVVLDDEREMIGVALQALGYDKNSTDATQLAEAKDKLIALLPNILKFNSDNPENELISGEAWAGIVYNGNATLAHDEDENIDYICPTEGCGVWFDTLAIPKGAPHVSNALAFINFILDPAESALITEEFGYSTPNAAALTYMETSNPDLYEWYMSFSGTNPSDAFLDNAVLVVDVGEATTMYDQIWTEVKAE